MMDIFWLMWLGMANMDDMFVHQCRIAVVAVVALLSCYYWFGLNVTDYEKSEN